MENKVEVQTEIPMQNKTNQQCYSKLEDAILAMHPYELPDIIVLNTHGGYNPYLQWVKDQILK